jgi:microcystin degradation protein MlrC
MAGTLRFGVAGIVQESNTFAPFLSTLDDFSVEEGTAVLTSSRGTNTEVGGFVEELDALAVEIVPLLSAWAVSAGAIEDSAFEALADRLIGQIKTARFDGLLLALHGSWLSSSRSSADAKIVSLVRRAIGPEIPIVITLDFHANVTPPLLEEIQGLVGYRTYPHIDMADTGRKAARLLHQVVTENLRPRLYWLSIPLIAPPQSATTDRPPIQDVLRRLDSELPPEDTLASSFFCVQPWLDTKELQSSMVAVMRSENTRVESILRAIADDLWQHRSAFHVDWVDTADLVARVLREPSRPVIVSEAFDGTGGGAPGDHPGLLSILLPHREHLSACLFMVDQEASRQAHESGIGGHFHGTLGAAIDKRFGPPLHVDARVRHLSDGRFLLKGPVFTGRTADMGIAAVLEIGRIKVVVGSRSTLVIDPELYRSQQIEPEQQDIVAVKSPTLFRPGYSAMLRRVLDLDMPGVCRGNLAKVPFVRLTRPLYPLDDFVWKASDQPVLRLGG